MRNLKKVLSLTLALVMMLSMMTFAGAAETTKKTAADLTDIKDVVNKEAVSLLVDLKVVAGRDDGAFDPTGSLKRAEFAKLVYVAKVGDDDKAANFIGAATGLTDVAGTWFEGYVNYAYSTGIVSGTSKTTFTPNGLVKVAEAAKMLLVGLGYDAKAEGYSDNALWSVNVMQQAKQTGLLDGVKLGANVVLTRDAAAQMVYNALLAKTVSVTYGFDMNGKKYITGANINATTWGEEVFDLQKVEGLVDKIVNGKAYVNGRLTTMDGYPEVVGANVVFYKNRETGKTISTALVVTNSTILGTSNNGTSLADLKNEAKLCYIADLDASRVTYVNGVEDTTNGQDALADKAGVIVEFIDNNDNGKADVVRITKKTVATIDEDAVIISKANTANNQRVDALVIHGVVPSATALEFVKGYEGLKEDDVVLFVEIGDRYFIEKAASVTGSVTGKKAGAYVLGGDTYSESGLVVPGTVEDVIKDNYNKDTTLYLDDSKSVVKAVLNEKAAPAQYAAVADITFVPGKAGAVGAAAKIGHAEALLVYPDGTSEIKTIATINGATPVDVDATTATISLLAAQILAETGETASHYKTVADAIGAGLTIKDLKGGSGTPASGAVALTEGTYYRFFDGDTTSSKNLGTYVAVHHTGNVKLEGLFYSYTVNKNGTLALSSAPKDTALGSAQTYKSGTPTIGAANVKVDNATIFIVPTVKNGKDVFTIYQGISKLPNMSAATTGVASFAKNTSVNAAFVYLSKGAVVASDAITNTAFILSKDYKDYVPATKDADEYFVYDAIVKGKVTTVKAATAAFSKAGLYDMSYVDGMATGTLIVGFVGDTTDQIGDTDMGIFNTLTGIVKAKNGVVGVGGAGNAALATYYTYNDDTKVFYIDSKGVVTAGTVAGIASDGDDQVFGILEKPSTGAGAVGTTTTQQTTLTTLFIRSEGVTGGIVPPTPGVATAFTVTKRALTQVSLTFTIACELDPVDSIPKDTGNISYSVVPQRMLPDGNWMPMQEILVLGSTAGATDVNLTTTYKGIEGNIYRFVVTVTCGGESVSYTTAAFEAVK